MMLVDDGKLSLDDPVAKYIPAFADVKVGVEKPDQSGKPVLTLQPLERPITGGDFDNAEFAKRLAKLPLAAQPGTLWDYGHSTDLLGRVIEVVSGQSLF